MRLSDVKGERTLDVVADIIDPIANIAEDEVASELFTRKKLPEKGHKKDVITILSTIEGTSPKEYTGALNLAKLFKDCVELLTDEAFEELFISAQNETLSGSAPESTEAPKA